MDAKCKKHLEDVPILDGHCRVNLTSKLDDSTEHIEASRAGLDHWKSNKYYRVIQLMQSLLIVLVLCFAAFLIYLSVSDRTFLNLDGANQRRHLPINESSSEPRETNFRDEQFRKDERKHDRLSLEELRTILLSTMDRRKRRHLDANLCKQSMEHCKIVMDSMTKIVNTVNNSMPHLLEFLKNFSTDKDTPKSKLVELVECLQCKNDSITFIDETGPDNLMNEARTMHENRDQIESNVDTVCNLLDEPNSNLVDASKSGEEGAKKLTKWTFVDSDDGRKEDLHGAERKAETTTSWTSNATKYESKNARTEAESAETTPMTEQTIDDTKGITVSANVTAKPDDGDVTEITIELVHPSLQPSIQGHETEREGVEGTSRQMKMRDPQSRIVTKGNVPSTPGMIPTAETMKSSQQLVLTPTISWIPHQVCFFGPGSSNNPTKQSTGGADQGMYGASSAAEIGYPISQHHRQGYQNTNHAPNYVQVQAQSVQFFPGNIGLQNGGQKFQGPTGPAVPNFPIFPRQQPSLPSGNANSKTPYYCTFIPAPTFQFPSVPGVSEYNQRSSVKYGSNEKEDDSEDEYPGSCPSNMIRCNDEKRCVFRTQWCDGLVDCYDASDETTCSCRDRISQERLCDGYFDCPHGEDELGCLGCPKTSFSCNDWQRRYSKDNCVPLSQRCDGVKNCANGKDEMECNILTPSFLEGKNVFTIGYNEGYLHKNFKGQWYPVCTVVKSWTKDACISEIGHDISGYPEVKIHSMPANAYRGPYIAEVNDRIKLVPSCMDTAVFVRCPRSRCGTSAFSHEDSLEPHVLEKEERNTFQMFDELVWPGYRNRIDPMKFDENGDKEDDMVGSQLRVVGGRASQPKAWPFLVAIYKNGVFCCGGVILNEMWILTAAHCLEGYTDHYFEIQAGILRRHSFSPMSQIRKARHTVMHPRYNGKDMKNDIGMIKLDDPLRFNRWIRQVCLPSKDILGPMWRNKPEPNSTCVAIGWGALREYGPDPDHLREVEVPILKNCKHEVDQNEAAICAGYPQGGRDACQGDSGGPLLCRNPYSESQWYVAGIISHGEGCARPNEPGAYTRVSYFLNWIQEISSDQGIVPLRRTPLKRCPGFSCEGGLGKCLPVEARCNRVIDCLDGEDEVNCRHYPIYRQLGNASFENNVPSTMEMGEDPTKPGEIFTSVSPLFDDTSNKPADRSEDRMSNELELNTASTTSNSNLKFDDETSTTTSTTFSSNYVENASSITSTRFPTIFTCTRLLQSVTIEKRCDRVVDCEDSTDELNCTCKDYLQNLRPTAICDGYADCDDLTDERDCELCGKNEFFCTTSRNCISMSKKCDGKFDCEFKEDELDCFAFTNGHRVYLDANGRPFLNKEGILTRYIKERWQPVCHRPKIHKNQSTTKLIGQNMCEYFGFANFESSESITVKNSKLETIAWQKKNFTFYREASSTTSLSQAGNLETCLGLYIRCASTLDGNAHAYLTSDSNTGRREHLWPWLAAIFVDGRFRCEALLLDSNWLLSATKCLENVRLDSNYTTAVLGHGSLFRHIDGPHQQISIVDELHPVNNSVSILLHLKSRVHFDRYVQPLFLDKTIYLPGANDSCVAVGFNGDHEAGSIFLKPVLENCSNCQRCFVNRSECWKNETNWSGTIFCRGRKGWYPAAVFEDNQRCNFTDSVTSIEYINPYLMEAIDGPRKSIEPTCHGFRCNIGHCLPQNRVCDGVPDCRDEGDEEPEYCGRFRENCENAVEGCNCTRTELRCRNGKCVDRGAFCDRRNDCFDGSDEPEVCTCSEYLKLTAPQRVCDGVRHCVDKSDEAPEMCPCRESSFKCKTMNGRDICVPRDFVCDGANDCPSGEDEAVCRMLMPFSNDSDSSGEMIRRSYGVWHTECFSSPVSPELASDLCKSMGYSSGDVINGVVATDQPTTLKLDNFYIAKINDWVWLSLIRGDKPLVTLEKSNGTCHRAFLNCGSKIN